MTSLKSLGQAVGLSARCASSSSRLWIPTRFGGVMTTFPQCMGSCRSGGALHRLPRTVSPLTTAPQHDVHRFVPARGLSAAEYPAGAERDPESLPALPEFCSGCGVRLQDSDPDKAGFFQVPKNWGIQSSSVVAGALAGTEDSEDIVEGTDAEVASEGDDPPEGMEEGAEGWTKVKLNDFDLAVESWLDDYEKKTKKKKKKGKYAEEEKVDVSDWGSDEDEEDRAGSPPLFCSRCFSLTHYGQVKSQVAEGRLPEFDIGKKIGQKIALRRFRRSVILAVVDISDFDGSLPRAALKALLQKDYETGGLKTPRDTDLVIAVNKVDVVSTEASLNRLEVWVRQRCKEGGVPKPRSVHLVSASKGRGVPGLLKTLGELVGRRGDVWVVGAQNSGKSSLINALRVARKRAGGGQVDPKQLLTIAALPGTTLGMIPVNGIMPKGAQMFDTPGVPHPYQLTSILTAAEARMLLPQRQLKPRTYRLGAGGTVLMGAVGRVDVLECPAATLYVTVWTSDELSTHMGKTETSGELWGKHAGGQLVPPIGDERVTALGRLEPHEIAVRGNSWTKSSMDICIAGLGWVAIGADGSALFRVWAPAGVAVTSRKSLLLDYARDFCKPGFTSAKGSVKKKGGSGGGGKKGRKPKK